MNILFLHTHAAGGTMGEILLHSLMEALADGLSSGPILLLAYLVMEALEHSQLLREGILSRFSRKAGPAIGGVLGIIPQCGISGAAATLFSTGTITVGTMLAVFFATSDEMLILMLTELAEGHIRMGEILAVAAGKAALGILLGYLADWLLRGQISEKKDAQEFCHREGCDCDHRQGNVFLSALYHTGKILAVLIGVNFCLNVLFALVGTEVLANSFLGIPVVGELALGLFGLIPNCAVSVVVTQGYLNGILDLGQLFAALLANGGIGLLVLLRTNRNPRENGKIIGVLYALSVAAGCLIGFVM